MIKYIDVHYTQFMIIILFLMSKYGWVVLSNEIIE